MLDRVGEELDVDLGELVYGDERFLAETS